MLLENGSANAEQVTNVCPTATTICDRLAVGRSKTPNAIKPRQAMPDTRQVPRRSRARRNSLGSFEIESEMNRFSNAL